LKTIIAGSRSINDYSLLEQAIERIKETDIGIKITEVVSGTARGVDRLGEKWARNHNVPIKKFPANWDELGKFAGYKRNLEMAKYAQVAIILWDGKSLGTLNMINHAKDHLLHLFVFNEKGEWITP
jgi:hypothetical protein